VVSMAADEGLALFAGLNAIPKKGYLSEYFSGITPPRTTQLLAASHEQLSGSDLFIGELLNCVDAHSTHTVSNAGSGVELHICPPAINHCVYQYRKSPGCVVEDSLCRSELGGTPLATNVSSVLCWKSTWAYPDHRPTLRGQRAGNKPTRCPAALSRSNSERGLKCSLAT
jgi:hypothetical protein